MEEEHRQQVIEEETIEIQSAEHVVVNDEVTVKVQPVDGEAEDLDEVERMAALLNEPEESAQLEPGRIQLIAKQLSKEFEKHKVVDWESRDAIQAKLRNVARVILRKYGYPVAARDPIVEKLLEAFIEEYRTRGAES